MKPFGLVGDLISGETPDFGMVGNLVSGKTPDFGMVGRVLADPDDPDQGVLGRMAGGIFDNALGMADAGGNGGGIVGMAGSYPSSEVGGIISQALDNIQGATSNLEGKAAGYRDDADALRRTLGVIPAIGAM